MVFTRKENIHLDPFPGLTFMAIYIIMYTHVSKSNDCLKERGMIMHTHIIVEIMVVAFLNRLNQIFISGMPYPSLSYQRLKLL